jgi:hypothetical protein
VEYMLLIYGDEAAWAARPEDERRRETERHVDCRSREEAIGAARELATLVSPEWGTIELRPAGGVDTRGRVRTADRQLD